MPKKVKAEELHQKTAFELKECKRLIEYLENCGLCIVDKEDLDKEDDDLK